MKVEYTFKTATIKDELERTAEWLPKKRINQWQYILDSSADVETGLSIKINQTCIVMRNGIIAATFTLYHHQNDWDKRLWRKNREKPIYIQSLAANRTLSGGGAGRMIMDWVDRHVFPEGHTVCQARLCRRKSKTKLFLHK
ncbi:hypothetical protein [Peribacillus glennii]|uniref:Uncharacterized protein n=1 Tax=Peribacillus glennii TaxID=2303991 RepID=A0A372LG83_9BACI|nr:hypothetical protein [Peribacillus glennii]RFU65315.1 hypothetical protein D0466_05295 [Peribacillus glennii]